MFAQPGFQCLLLFLFFPFYPASAAQIDPDNGKAHFQRGSNNFPNSNGKRQAKFKKHILAGKIDIFIPDMMYATKETASS